MNRGDNETPAGSSCGGMYKIRAQVMCEVNVRCERSEDKVYSGGAEAPDTNKAKRAVRVCKNRRDKDKIRFKDSKKLVEGQPVIK